MTLRSDLQQVADWIQPESLVLDLGCGDGSLLAHLQQAKSVQGYGVEIDVEKVVACTEKGVRVVQSDLEQGLALFQNQRFDFVVLSMTLQAMHRIETIVEEMLRVGRVGIVTFPNFGFWENRWQILRGRMPVSETIPYEWYNTPNIHLCTVRDFEHFLTARGMRIVEQVVMHQDRQVSVLPNLLGSLAVVKFQRV